MRGKTYIPNNIKNLSFFNTHWEFYLYVFVYYLYFNIYLNIFLNIFSLFFQEIHTIDCWTDFNTLIPPKEQTMKHHYSHALKPTSLGSIPIKYENKLAGSIGPLSWSPNPTAQKWPDLSPAEE